jgi:hypothetical protein
VQFIILISFFFPTSNSLVYSEFCAQRAHLHTTNCHHSHIFYFLVIILSPTYIGFNSNPTRTNGLISPHCLPPQKHKLTTKQPKTQETTIIMVTSARCSPVALILMVSKIALCRTIDNNHCNTAMQILYVQLTFPLFYLHLFYTARLSELAD